MAAAIPANPVPAAVPAPADRAVLLHQRGQEIKQLRNFYLEKQNRVEDPVKGIALIASVIVTMAVVILGNITSLLGCIGIGFCFTGATALLMPRLVNRLDQTNKQAADALLAPGFYDFAMRDPRQLSSAEQINATFARFLATPAQ